MMRSAVTKPIVVSTVDKKLSWRLTKERQSFCGGSRLPSEDLRLFYKDRDWRHQILHFYISSMIMTFVQRL